MFMELFRKKIVVYDRRYVLCALGELYLASALGSVLCCPKGKGKNDGM